MSLQGHSDNPRWTMAIVSSAKINREQISSLVFKKRKKEDPCRTPVSIASLWQRRLKVSLSCTRQNIACRLREGIPSLSSAIMRPFLEFWAPPFNKYINLKEGE